MSQTTSSDEGTSPPAPPATLTSSKESAKDRAAAHDRMLDDRRNQASSTLACRTFVASRAFATAKALKKPAVSIDHRPPTSPARVTNLTRPPSPTSLLDPQAPPTPSKVFKLTPSALASLAASTKWVTVVAEVGFVWDLVVGHFAVPEFFRVYIWIFCLDSSDVCRRVVLQVCRSVQRHRLHTACTPLLASTLNRPLSTWGVLDADWSLVMAPCNVTACTPLSLPDSQRILSTLRVLERDGSSFAFRFTGADLSISLSTVPVASVMSWGVLDADWSLVAFLFTDLLTTVAPIKMMGASERQLLLWNVEWTESCLW